MRKFAFVIDGWFMRKTIYRSRAFFYNGPNIRKYCALFLQNPPDGPPVDKSYRIFYYDTTPLQAKGHNPITGHYVDFAKGEVAVAQEALFKSIKMTPHFALRLGVTSWQGNGWFLSDEKLHGLLKKNITVDDLGPHDVKPKIQQKAVDMKMGLDIALLATKKLADVLIVITGDSDIVPALKLARREGLEVGLDPLRCPIKPELREHADFVASKVRPDMFRNTETQGEG